MNFVKFQNLPFILETWIYLQCIRCLLLFSIKFIVRMANIGVFWYIRFWRICAFLFVVYSNNFLVWYILSTWNANVWRVKVLQSKKWKYFTWHFLFVFEKYSFFTQQWETLSKSQITSKYYELKMHRKYWKRI